VKYRSGFVSNSSSSSFLVITPEYSPHYEKQDITYFIKDGVLYVNECWCGTEFGWCNVRYDHIGDKLAFAYLQCCYLHECGANKSELVDMIDSVMKEAYPEIREINWDSIRYDFEDNDAYIDHQSNACANENIEIFDSVENMRDFLINPLSYIQGDNDNH